MQRSFEDLGRPLHEVTFVVVDLETTGGSHLTCGITEIGAVKLRGGECLGTFQTLVNPGVPIPPEITIITGITTAMVVPAPKIDAVLPAFLDFVGDAVIVGHNIRFDMAFLQAALRDHGWSKLTNRTIDTCGLARRLVREDVRNCQLGTLAEHFRLGHRPTHRALDDALATGELLHRFLEQVGPLGVTGLDDLLALPKVEGHPQLAKLKLTTGLPRSPGVYLFKDATGRVVYVGRAVDLRRRVRSYFTGDGRRKVGSMLRTVHRIDHIVCAGELEAAVLEVRLIHELFPRFNRQAKVWKKYAYLKLTLDERFPRFSVVKAPKANDGCLYLGPLSSTAMAKQVQEAIETAVPIRRCTKKPGRDAREGACASAQLGVSTCPCSGQIGEEGYAAIVDTVVRGLTGEPELLLAPLAARMRALAGAGRFEEAASMRDRASALARALNRQRRLDGLRRTGRLVVEIDGAGTAVLERGILQPQDQLFSPTGITPEVPLDGPLPKALADELGTVAAWLEQRAALVRVVECDGELTSVLPRLPSFVPGKAA